MNPKPKEKLPKGKWLGSEFPDEMYEEIVQVSKYMRLPKTSTLIILVADGLKVRKAHAVIDITDRE